MEHSYEWYIWSDEVVVSYIHTLSCRNTVRNTVHTVPSTAIRFSHGSQVDSDNAVDLIYHRHHDITTSISKPHTIHNFPSCFSSLTKLTLWICCEKKGISRGWNFGTRQNSAACHWFLSNTHTHNPTRPTRQVFNNNRKQKRIPEKGY